jgi:hypothetical protein
VSKPKNSWSATCAAGWRHKCKVDNRLHPRVSPQVWRFPRK